MAKDDATLSEEELYSAINMLREMVPEEELNLLQPSAPNAVYTTLVTLWMLTLQRLGCGNTLAGVVRDVLSKNRELLPKSKRVEEGTLSLSSAAYSNARQRLDLKTAEYFANRVSSSIIESSPFSWFEDRRAFIIDGTTITLEPTPELQEAFPPATNQHGETVWPVATDIAAFVADDFQPSCAYNETYLGPHLCRLPPVEAAAMRCIWVRLVWALALERGWPLAEFFQPHAIDLLGKQCESPIGPLNRIMGSQLVPPQRSELGRVVAESVKKDLGRTPNGEEIRNWLYSAGCIELASSPNLEAFVQNGFYQQYFAATDPFFPKTIKPFEPGLPLLLVPRLGDSAVNARGLPSLSERYQHMTRPKVETLRLWGWNVEIFPTTGSHGTSFSGGAAQKWVLTRLRDVLQGQ